MELTEENKKHIDAMSYEGLLSEWRNAPGGYPWFQGETGAYWAKCMTERRAQSGGNNRHAAASKKIGY